MKRVTQKIQLIGCNSRGKSQEDYVAPALDGGENVQGIVAYRDGLAGKIRLRLLTAETFDHGTVQLHYAVLSADD
jgi:hypothetical protein